MFINFQYDVLHRDKLYKKYIIHKLSYLSLLLVRDMDIGNEKG